MLYLIIITLILTILLYITVKDKVKVLKINGYITTISGIIILLLGGLSKYLVKYYIKEINLNNITNYFLLKFTIVSTILIIIGLIEILLSKYKSLKYHKT